MKIKICGIIDPEDAISASRVGADYIGLIFAKSSKRCVDKVSAVNIVQAAKENGATPVGVFVEQQSDEIITLSKSLGLSVIQLHGNKCRDDIHLLSPHFTQIFYSIDVDRHGFYPPIPPLPQNTILLFDSEKSAVQKPFDFNQFLPPEDKTFFLAGGLNADNIQGAIKQTHPEGIDVAGGVEMSNSLRKCPRKMKIFIEAVKGAIQ